MKVNIANYLIEDFSSRFPISNTGVIDNDIIDVMVNGWFNNRYHTPSFNIAADERYSQKPSLLM